MIYTPFNAFNYFVALQTDDHIYIVSSDRCQIDFMSFSKKLPAPGGKKFEKLSSFDPKVLQNFVNGVVMVSQPL